MGMRRKTYASVDKMREDLIKLNEDFGRDEENPVVGLVCNLKSKNAYIKCIYKDCKYEHWFTYEGQGTEEPEDFKYSRSINKNHSVAAHASGQQRD